MFDERCNDAVITRRVHRAQIENLYIEAMVLADEAQAAFAAQRESGARERQAHLDRALQIGLACEALKTTARLMHVIAWLLHRRGLIVGEAGIDCADSAGHIGEPVPADWDVCAAFDPSIRRIITASEHLFERVTTLEAGWEAAPATTPVQAMLARIEAQL